MIEHINIQNFGSFHNFDWRTSIPDSGGNIVKFKKLNILYGRNYSGKTNLSRILRSLQTGELPQKFEAPLFKVTTDLGIFTQTQIPSNEHHIRVYNNDFVDDHLGFLRDSEGKITPFAIIGSENKALELEIATKKKELGSEEEEQGLRHKYALKHAEYAKAQENSNGAEKKLIAKLTNKATQLPKGIKHNSI